MLYFFRNYHSAFIRSPQIAATTDTNRAYLAHAQLLEEMKVLHAGINGLGETLSGLHSATPVQIETSSSTFVSTSIEISDNDTNTTDNPMTFADIMEEEKRDRVNANVNKNVLKYYNGKWHLSPRVISFKNINVPQLWELWYNGNKADPTEVIPPYRQLLDSDFAYNSSFRKAKGVIERLHFIIAERGLVLKSMPIPTMKLSEITDLGKQAIRSLYSRAVEVSRENNTPIDATVDLMSMSFSTYFDRVSHYVKLPEEDKSVLKTKRQRVN